LSLKPSSFPPEPAPHAERVRGADGQAYWKLTCFCGKILLAPGDGSHTHGLCPQCGKSLLFPTERSITSGPLRIIPANRPQRSPSAKRPAAQRPATAPERVSSRERDSSKDRINPGHSASDNAADKLRPNSARSIKAATGLVSAWPAAEKIPRALAAFIDATIAVTLFAALLWAAPYLPAHFSTSTFRVAFALIVLWLNEGVLQWLWNGSVGKKLCVISIREEGGEPLRIENALLRPFLKWALLPAWPLAFFDPNGLALHDKVLSTVVLKGRA
jgi:uncharacterized RDD family membrane protein YckC